MCRKILWCGVQFLFFYWIHIYFLLFREGESKSPCPHSNENKIKVYIYIFQYFYTSIMRFFCIKTMKYLWFCSVLLQSIKIVFPSMFEFCPEIMKVHRIIDSLPSSKHLAFFPVVYTVVILSFVSFLHGWLVGDNCHD